MNIKKWIHSETSKYIISIILGLGLSTLFRKECYGENCIVFRSPPVEELEKEMFELEQELDIPSHLRWHNSKPKQETLEELSNEYAIGKSSAEVFRNAHKRDFIAGFKACEEQNKNMYSEEEVENILIEYVKTNPTKPYRVVSWFQQFKKK